ncbi:MAG: PQQ-binding-like beta-propeller repeat protein [bacterium]
MKRFEKLLRISVLPAISLFCLALKPDKESSSSGVSANSDWPQWRGPNRDGISAETGILKTWPPEGPKILWRMTLGNGFSTISIANGRAYTMFSDGTDEYVLCVDASSGQEKWRFKSDKNYVERQGGDGPRCTPLVDGSFVYALSAFGKLYGLDAGNGKKIWDHDLQKEFGAKMPIWGISTTPMIEGELLLIDVGGKSGHSLMAFDKRSGKTVWHSQTDQPGYSAPIAVTVGGVRQLIFFTGANLISVSPKDGKPYWSQPWQTQFFVNAATPVFIPEDKIFISSGYEQGAGLFQIQTNNGRPTAQSVWLNKNMRNHMATSVYLNGNLYGFDEANFKCLDAATGEDKWKTRGLGKGTVMLADGHLIVLSERGKLVLAEASSEGYVEKASAQILRGKCWTSPSLANGKLYLRNEREMVCLDLKGGA